jgi:hypothetical protein
MPRLMETISTKPALIATNRLRQTLAAVARLLDQSMNDVSVVDSEYQARISQAAQEAEATLEQRIAERLKSAIDDAEQNTRVLVTEELEGRLKEEIADAVGHAAAEWERERAQMTADVQRANQLLEQSREEYNRELAETDEAAAIALDRQIVTAVERVRTELRARWDAERTQLVAERDRAIHSLAERDSEHQRMLADVQRVAGDNLDDKMAKALEQWEMERAELIAEIQRAQHESAESASNHQRQLSGAVDRVRSEFVEEQERLRRELEQAKRACAHLRQMVEANKQQSPPRFDNGQAKSSVETQALHAEVARIEGLIEGISRVIEDPDTELSVVIRKNAERAELESYLRGVRFAIPSK